MNAYTIQLPNGLVQRAKAKARKRGELLDDVIIGLLKGYVDETYAQIYPVCVICGHPRANHYGRGQDFNRTGCEVCDHANDGRYQIHAPHGYQ